MRTCILICTLFIISSSFAQQQGRRYSFKEVGWTIILPFDFKTIDSVENAVRAERGKKALEEANNIKAEVNATKTLISATKNTYNYFNSTFTPFDPKKDGDYKASNQNVKDLMFKAFLAKIPNAKVDSSSSTEIIDGLTFDKFHIAIYTANNNHFNLYLLAKYYKGYDFGISYLYLDETTKQQIESMLHNSRFKK